jgi:hypothetical protein
MPGWSGAQITSPHHKTGSRQTSTTPLRAESTALRAIQARPTSRCSRRGSRSSATWEQRLYADTALRQAIEQGWILVEIINSGIIIGGMGGQFFRLRRWRRHSIVYPNTSTPTRDEIVAVRQNVLFGARVIKCVDCNRGLHRRQIRLVIREAAKAG